MNAPGSVDSNDVFVRLYGANLIPLKIIVASLTWVLHDYFVTLEDEVEYFWSSKPSFGKYTFLFLRYYTIVLLMLYVFQIHAFSVRGVPTLDRCIAVDPSSRVAGAISLWLVEIIMQMRVYVLFNKNKKIAIFNGVLFGMSIVTFICFLVFNAMKRAGLISRFVHMPLPGCPAINGALQWVQWLPATAFEIILFGFVIYKAINLSSERKLLKRRVLLADVMIHENVLYFALITVLLLVTNLMVVPYSPIPWFSMGPFHASVGIFTCRMMIHLRKFSKESLEAGITMSKLPDLEIPESRPETPVLVNGQFLDSEEILEHDDGNHRQRASDEESVIESQTTVIRPQTYSANCFHHAGPSRLH